MNLENKNTVLVTCGPGLADYLKIELEELGFTIRSFHTGGLEIRATGKEVMQLNLHLRTAYNVLFLLKQFTCKNPKELYEQVSSLQWEDMIGSDEFISVVSRVNTPTIDNSMFASMKVKDAIVDRLMGKTGSRPNSGSRRDCLVYHLYWKEDTCWLYLNTSGIKLSDRGYRKIPHQAPLREVLAAGILMQTGYDGSSSLVLPMCGSGTLAIEAALIALQRPCGLLRSNYGFMHEKDFDKDLWQQIRKQAQDASKKTRKQLAPIIATDIDERAVNAARKNAMTAGVDHLIKFEVCDFFDTEVPIQPGVVLLNPEYGKRLGEIDQLEAVYKQIGDFFKQKCPGYTAYIFTGNPALGKKVGLKTSRRTVFFNGNIECRLLKYDMYAGTRQ